MDLIIQYIIQATGFLNAHLGSLNKIVSDNLKLQVEISQNSGVLQADVISKKLLEEYIMVTKDYGIPEVEEKKKELTQYIEDARAHLIKKNTALMAAYCYDPLMDAYRELHMEVSYTLFNLGC